MSTQYGVPGFRFQASSARWKGWSWAWRLIGWMVVACALVLLNVQWHFDRMCAAVYSTSAVVRLDGVYCETALGLMRLNVLFERHERVQREEECKAANPGREYLCDPRYVPPTVEGSG